MAKLTYAEICKHLHVTGSGPDITFTAVSTDSRNVPKGALFVALPGEQHDGHDYLEQAIAAGAAAVLISKNVVASVPTIKVKDTLLAYGQVAALYRQKFNIPMAAVTGSCGKTTVKNMIASILQQAGTVLAPPGSFNNEVGVPQTLLALQEQHQYAVFEMGAKNVGDIKYLMGLVHPQVALVNNVAPVHLATFVDVDNIARVKGEIYQSLAADGTAAVNIDDVYAPYWLSTLTTQKIITFGLEGKADITCSYIIEEHHQIKFELITDIGKTEVTMEVLGLHNVRNALAATAAARAMGITLDHIKAGLEKFQPTTRRMQVKQGKQGARIIDDSYNANPVAMQRAIDVLAKQQGRKIMVIGDMLEMGEHGTQAHAELGKQIRAAGIEKLYAFGDLTRHAVASYGADGLFYTNKAELTAALLTVLDKDTVVLVKGSNGMHLEEIVNVIVA